MSIKKIHRPGIVAHTFNPSTQESGAGGSLISKPSWSTYEVLCQPKYIQAHIHTHAYAHIHVRTHSRNPVSEEGGRIEGSRREGGADEGKKERNSQYVNKIPNAQL